MSGTTLKGIIKLNDTLLLGPDPLGRFTPIAVKSIHRKRMPVREVRGGQTASFALKKIKRSHIRKGMVMVAPVLNPQACWEFEGEILVLHHPTTISSRYQAMGNYFPKQYYEMLLQRVIMTNRCYSALWQHKANRFYIIHVSGLLENGRQGFSTF